MHLLFYLALFGPLASPPTPSTPSAPPKALRALVALPPHLFFFHTSQDGLCRYAQLLSTSLLLEAPQAFTSPRSRLNLRHNASSLHRVTKALVSYVEKLEEQAQTPAQKAGLPALKTYLEEATSLLEKLQEAALATRLPDASLWEPWKTWPNRCPTFPVPSSQAWPSELTQAWADLFEIFALSHEYLLFIQTKQLQTSAPPKEWLRLALHAQAHLDALRAWRLRQPKSAEVGLLLYHTALLTRSIAAFNTTSSLREACRPAAPCPAALAAEKKALDFLQKAEASLRSSNPSFGPFWRFSSP